MTKTFDFLEATKSNGINKHAGGSRGFQERERERGLPFLTRNPEMEEQRDRLMHFFQSNKWSRDLQTHCSAKAGILVLWARKKNKYSRLLLVLKEPVCLVDQNETKTKKPSFMVFYFLRRLSLFIHLARLLSHFTLPYSCGRRRESSTGQVTDHQVKGTFFLPSQPEPLSSCNV